MGLEGFLGSVLLSEPITDDSISCARKVHFFFWQAITNVETPQSLECIPKKKLSIGIFSVNHTILNPLYPEDSLKAALISSSISKSGRTLISLTLCFSKASEKAEEVEVCPFALFQATLYTLNPHHLQVTGLWASVMDTAYSPCE